jgi:hypothetical protein
MDREQLVGTLKLAGYAGSVPGEKVAKFTDMIFGEIEQAKVEGRAEDFSIAITCISYHL